MPDFVGESPEDLCRAADADLDRPLGVEHPGEHRLAKRPAMVEFGAVDLAHRVAMGVDMDEADGTVPAQRLQDRIGDRMIAADRQRPDAGRLDAGEERCDILDAAVEAEARAHRDVADIGRLALGFRHDTQGVVVGADPLDVAHRAGSKAGAGPVGDAQIHRHADQRDVEPAKIRQIGRLGPERQIEEGRDPGERHRPLVSAAKHQRQRLPEIVRRDFGFFGALVFGAQGFEFRLVEHGSPSASGRRGPAPQNQMLPRIGHFADRDLDQSRAAPLQRRAEFAAQAVGACRAHPGGAKLSAIFGKFGLCRSTPISRLP